VIHSGTSKKADKTIALDELPHQHAKQLQMISSFDIEYGNDPETSLGFQPGGNETEKLAPNAFRVNQDGTITICDPVHKEIFLLSSEKVLKAIEPYTFARVLEIKNESRNLNIRTENTGADTADIIYTDSPGTVRIQINGPLASVRVIGVTTGGYVYVLVERFIELGSLAVTREVIVLDSTGKLEARMQIDDVSSVPPVIEFQLTHDGSLYRMIPGDKSVTFIHYEVR
jgi:hypothetical protein